MEEINLSLDSQDIFKSVNVGSSPVGTNDSLNISLQSNSSPSVTNVSSIGGGEDLGIDLLVNKSKMSGERVRTPSPSINVENSINLDKLLEDTSTPPPVSNGSNIFSMNSNNNSSNNNSSNNNSNIFSEPKPGSLFNDESSNGSSGPTINNFYAAPQKSPEEIHREKVHYLRLFDSLERKGVRLEKKYTIEHDLEELKGEYERIKQRRDLDKSVRFQRKMLVAFVTGMEFLNNRFDPFDLKLDGWSESVHENAGDYDDIFEELHEKYKDKAQMAPEIKLLLMLGGSGFMFHLTNTMFKSSLPGMGDVLKQNPDLMQQFTKAAVNSMGVKEPGFANLMGDVLNVDRGSQMRAPPPPQRKEMNGPPDIDSILTDLSSNQGQRGISLDGGTGLSDSEIENIRNVETNNGKRSMTLDL
jgi:hypothetical protein